MKAEAPLRVVRATRSGKERKREGGKEGRKEGRKEGEG